MRYFNKLKIIIKYLGNYKDFIRIFNDYEEKEHTYSTLYNNFVLDFNLYNTLAAENKKAYKEYFSPYLYDKTTFTNIEPMYFYQDSWAFERIVNNKTLKHVDIGSHHIFVAHLSKVVDLTMVDIRPFSLPLDSIKFVKGSITNLPFENNSISSLSSLCVIEHIGLGRYGDKIDPDGSEKAFKEINRILKTGANFYFSVPVEDSNKVYFNAHRAFSENYLFKEILHNYTIIDKKYIYGSVFKNEIDNSIFGIGCYHLMKNK